MIYYDSSKWSAMLRLRGSVLPCAMFWALPSALSAYVLGWAAQEGYISVESLEVLTQSDIYSGFSYVLGFSLVFRTSQAYSRYWTAATSIHEMASEWSDSCASIVAFTSVSQAPKEEVETFRHTVVRLFSLLHAMAMSEVARVEDDLPLLDVSGLSAKSLQLLATSSAQGKKVHIVLSWIKTYITQQAASGLLNVPAPLLTRVFQELGSGLVKFHTAQQVVIWPFPFPYTQLNVVLMQIYAVVTPLVISTWGTWPAICALFTFISVTMLVGLNLIASELENPFGDDPNDLPVLELQKDINTFLAMQLDPLVRTPPELLPTHVSSHKELMGRGFWFNQSLNKRLLRSNTPSARLATALRAGARSDKLRAQMRWCGEETPESELVKVKAWLKCTSRRLAQEEQLHISEEVLAGGSFEKSLTSAAPSSEGLGFEETGSCSIPVPVRCRTFTSVYGAEPAEPAAPAFQGFLEELSQRLGTFLEELQEAQAQHLEKQLEAMESVGSGWTAEDGNAESEAVQPPLTQRPLLLRR